MESLPLEIIIEISWTLMSTTDLKNFRLVSKAFAYAASPALFHHVQAINTAECLEQLYKSQNYNKSPASAARHLTLYHGTWPYLGSFNEWKTHPQALSHDDLCKQAEMVAFAAYRRFANQEAARVFDSDVSGLAMILEMFPSLVSLTLSHVHTWRWGKFKSAYYNELCQKTRVVPFFKARVEDLACRLLPSLLRFPQITSLNIPSTLDIQNEEWLIVNENIVSLNVSNLVVRGYKHSEVQQFLRSFPNLQELVLCTESGGQVSGQRIALRSLKWPTLRRAHFRHLWTSENELIDFICQHQLQQLALRNVTLFSGTWKSFFSRIARLSNQTLQSAVCITTSGIRISLNEAARSHKRWPNSNASALNPRVYLVFGNCNKDRVYSLDKRDFWLTE
jgi:hypothetical protein